MADFQNSKSICVYKTDRYIFEVKDMLKLTDEKEIGRIHSPKFSRIHFLAASLVKDGQNLKQGTQLNHYLKPEDILTLIEIIREGTFDKIYATKYGSQYIEYKGTPNSKKYNGKPESRVLIVKHQEKIGNELARLPWTIVMQSGEGRIKGEGAITPINIAKPDEKIEIKFSNHDFIKILLTINRYITNWETIHFSKILKIQQNYIDKSNTSQKPNARWGSGGGVNC